jgi:hypothetical protein
MRFSPSRAQQWISSLIFFEHAFQAFFPMNNSQIISETTGLTVSSKIQVGSTALQNFLSRVPIYQHFPLLESIYRFLFYCAMEIMHQWMSSEEKGKLSLHQRMIHDTLQPFWITCGLIAMRSAVCTRTVDLPKGKGTCCGGALLKNMK